jgi:hypothetical protein
VLKPGPLDLLLAPLDRPVHLQLDIRNRLLLVLLLLKDLLIRLQHSLYLRG